MTNIHRRTLLKSSIPALTGSISLGAVADATPIQQLYQRWGKAEAEYKRIADEFDALLSRERETGTASGQSTSAREQEIVEPAYDALVRIENDIMAQAIAEPCDLAIKVVIALRVEGAHDDEQYRILKHDAGRILA